MMTNLHNDEEEERNEVAGDAVIEAV